MKNFNRFVLTAACAATLSLANQASAQYRATGDDGIAASPKVRQMLDERKHAASTCCTTVTSVGSQVIANDGIAASPRARQMLNERRMVAGTPSTASTAVASVGYQATGADGITASPKLREQLNERSGQMIMVAPLK